MLHVMGCRCRGDVEGRGRRVQPTLSRRCERACLVWGVGGGPSGSTCHCLDCTGFGRNLVPRTRCQQVVPGKSPNRQGGSNMSLVEVDVCCKMCRYLCTQLSAGVTWGIHGPACSHTQGDKGRQTAATALTPNEATRLGPVAWVHMAGDSLARSCHGGPTRVRLRVLTNHLSDPNGGFLRCLASDTRLVNKPHPASRPSPCTVPPTPQSSRTRVLRADITHCRHRKKSFISHKTHLASHSSKPRRQKEARHCHGPHGRRQASKTASIRYCTLPLPHVLSVMLGDVGQTARLCTCSLPGNRYRLFFARLTCGNKGEGRYDHGVDCRRGQEVLGKILYHTWARYISRCA